MATIHQNVTTKAQSLGVVLTLQHNPKTGSSTALVRTPSNGLALVFASPSDAIYVIPHLRARTARSEGLLP
jgi:hypothetical protein